MAIELVAAQASKLSDMAKALEQFFGIGVGRTARQAPECDRLGLWPLRVRGANDSEEAFNLRRRLYGKRRGGDLSRC